MIRHSTTRPRLRLTDDDHGEISVTVEGTEVRGWSYANSVERLAKMRMAREYCEGWHDGFAIALECATAILRDAHDPTGKPN